MTKLHHISALMLLVLMMAVALASCRKDEEELHIGEKQIPIAFASVAAEEESVTRAATPLARDFVVYGYKNVDGSEQTVFDGYKVSYRAGSANTSEDNTHGYYYVGGNQTIKYWDFSASDYHFWGVWRASDDRATFSGGKNNVLTITDIPLRVGEPAPDDDVLFSRLCDRCPVTSEVVELSFRRPYAKLCIQFYTTEPIESVKDNIELTQISFTPDPSATSPLVNKVYAKGDVRVTYPLTNGRCTGDGQETVELISYSEPQNALLFDVVTLSPGLGVSSNTAVTAPIDDSEGLHLGDMPGQSLNAPQTRAGGMEEPSDESPQTRAGEVPGKKYYYYPLPMNERNPAFTMQVCINGDRELKTAVVPANFMRWKANFFYTYIFKITEAGKKIELYDVTIDPWKFGGGMDEEWKNW